MFPPPRPEADGEYGEGLAPFSVDGPLIAVISTGNQHIRVFDRNGMVASAKVSTGRNGHETPEGVFSIIERKVEHNSNLYDDASMPFMQRITWTGVALHEGSVPGYRASHGCIRLPSGFAERLFRTTKIATRVVIVPHDGVPLPLSHPVLFQPGPPPPAPKPSPATEAAAPAQPAPGDAAASAQPAPGDTAASASDQPMVVGVALAAEPAAAAAPTAPEPPVAAPAPTPPAPTGAELKARRAAAERRQTELATAVTEARASARPRFVEQGQAEKALRQALALAHRAERHAQALEEAVLAARWGADEDSAIAAHLDALIELALAQGREETAREVSVEKAAAARAAQDTVRKLEAERQAAQNEARVITRKLAPITIFVSRQTGRIYVRQAFREVMDVPVTIRDPDRQLGTHVFTALDAGENSETVKWVALSVDGPAAEASEAEQSHKRRRGEGRKSAGHAGDPLQAARMALDRIEMPQEVLARVMPVLQPGSTLIVSDLGPSVETGPGTDVVVQTKGEQQAVQTIASFTAKKKSGTAAEAGYTPPSARRRDGWASSRNYWGRW
jgi:hypothetical protein